MDSLLPRIWAVEAVGMGASSRLLRTPCLTENEVDKVCFLFEGKCLDLHTGNE